LKILFITWDGPQASYLQSLFLPIFKKLAENDFDFHIMQFTWGDSGRIETNSQACIKAGFTYQSVTICRRPLAVGGLLTVYRGVFLIRRALREQQIDVVMPRSTIPAMSALIALRGNSLPMVFDADGLPLDERVEFAGRSPTGFVYRFMRDIEAQAIRRAALVITRTTSAEKILLARAGAGTSRHIFHVVSNGRDTQTFKPICVDYVGQVRRNLHLPEHAPLLVYAGSIGPQYCLDEMLQLFSSVRSRRHDAHFLILTGDPELINKELSSWPELIPAITTMSVPPLDVPKYLACADLGLALRRPSFSMQGVAPVKLGEYLLCGLPVVATSEIAEARSITAEIGFLVRFMDTDELFDVANWFVDDVLKEREKYRRQCREAGLEKYSLEGSVQSYVEALANLPGYKLGKESPGDFDSDA